MVSGSATGSIALHGERNWTLFVLNGFSYFSIQYVAFIVLSALEQKTFTRKDLEW